MFIKLGTIKIKLLSSISYLKISKIAIYEGRDRRLNPKYVYKIGENKIKWLKTRNMYRRLVKFRGIRQNVFSELKISKNNDLWGKGPSFEFQIFL